mmetsp:Transcript_60721/g.112654  ORF Transcript_60721/g.112654 Transcript_60721/m.112654 type:complete len:416 (-) Transcript_60721:19-1266(-)
MILQCLGEVVTFLCDSDDADRRRKDIVLDGEQDYEIWMQEVAQKEQVVDARVQRMLHWKASGGWQCADTGGCVGLRNMRNTCWMNSILQSLAHVEPLTALLLQLRPRLTQLSKQGTLDEDGLSHSPKVPRNRQTMLELSLLQDATHLQVAYQFIELLHNMWQERQRTALVPGFLQRALRTKAPFLFPKGIQQDAYDFFSFLINTLDEELQEMQPKKELVSTMFQGEMRSSLICQDCGYTSSNPEMFQTLSLPVQCEANKEVDLNEVMKSFCVEEILEGKNSWKCEKCDRRVRATKKLEVVRLPLVLVLHLKRFAFDKLCGRVQKVRAQVTIKDGVDALNLSQYVPGHKGDPVIYDVIGTVNHHGPDATSGHYTAHCRNCVYNEWHFFNDDEVQLVNAEDVWSPEEVYLIFLLQRV